MTLLLKIDPRNPDAEKLAEAVRVLCEGGVVAFPTETFYGLGADARNAQIFPAAFAEKSTIRHVDRRSVDQPVQSRRYDLETVFGS